MIVLNDYYRGLICRCPGCYAILGYGPQDVHSNSYVSCPKCKFEILTKMMLDYDGVIREDDTNGKAVVSEQTGN